MEERFHTGNPSLGRKPIRPWLLAIFLIEVATFANTRADEFILEYADAIFDFSRAKLDFSYAGYTLTGEVVLVIDGDTFQLQSGPVRRQVDLAGIDAPELGQTFGDHARHYLLDMVESQTVRVEVSDTDRFGNILGELFVNQISINKLMLKDGYAWAIRGFWADRNLQGQEQLARDRGIGLWRNEDAIPPWKYRELPID